MFFLLYCIVALALVEVNGQILRSNRVVNWGEWHPWATCPPGAFAYGFLLEWQAGVGAPVGSFVTPLPPPGDETGLNAIYLLCSKPGVPRERTLISSGRGRYGDTMGELIECERGSFVYAFELFEHPHEGHKDDVAVQNLKVRCQRLDGTEAGNLVGDARMRHGFWYKSNPNACNNRGAVCGMRTQIEMPQGMY